MSGPWDSGAPARGSLEAPSGLSSFEGPAVYFDGRVARRREVTLRLGPTLTIIEDGAPIESWAYHDIRRADGGPGMMRLCSVTAAELARLDISDKNLASAIESRCPRLGDLGLRVRGVGAIVFWSLAATISIALIAILGRLSPPTGSRRSCRSP